MPIVRSLSTTGSPCIIEAANEEELLGLETELVKNLFVDTGAIIFRSFNCDAANLSRFVDRFSTSRTGYPGAGRKSVVAGDKIQTVSEGSAALELHSELCHTPFRPDICWFLCVRASHAGGETTLCEGSALVNLLSSDLRRFFSKATLRYRWVLDVRYVKNLIGTEDDDDVAHFLSDDPRGVWYSWAGDRIAQDFMVPALHEPKFQPGVLAFGNQILHNAVPGRSLKYPTLGDGTIIDAAIIETVRLLASQVTIEIAWRDGDLLMFDNTRYMHGRRPILDPARAVWTVFSDARL
jgi:hypothetical protein